MSSGKPSRVALLRQQFLQKSELNTAPVQYKNDSKQKSQNAIPTASIQKDKQKDEPAKSVVDLDDYDDDLDWEEEVIFEKK